MATSFPLAWPDGWNRTAPHRRQRSRYKVTGDSATKHLMAELGRMGAHRSSLILSTNIVLRNDGMPYSRQPNHAIDDPGAAIYWSTTAFKDRVIACDKWDNVYDNIHALGLAIAAMRAIDRAGASQVMERAFTAFGALPASSEVAAKRAWWDVLGVPQTALGAFDVTMLDARYRELAKKAHPDAGGSAEAMTELNQARDEMRQHYARGT